MVLCPRAFCGVYLAYKSVSNLADDGLLVWRMTVFSCLNKKWFTGALHCMK